MGLCNWEVKFPVEKRGGEDLSDDLLEALTTKQKKSLNYMLSKCSQKLHNKFM